MKEFRPIVYNFVQVLQDKRDNFDFSNALFFKHLYLF